MHTAIDDAVASGAAPAMSGAVDGRALGLYVTGLGAVLAVAGAIRTLGPDADAEGSTTIGDESREMDMQ